MPLTDDQIQMLTALTVACRPHHAPRWDPAGTATFIRKVADRSLPSVMRACAAAAADPANRTPAVIPQPGAHWRADDTTPAERVVLADLCRDCGGRRGAGHPVDHEWVSLTGKPVSPGYGSDAVREARELARAARKAAGPELVAARRPLVAHTGPGPFHDQIVARSTAGVASEPDAGAGSDS